MSQTKSNPLAIIVMIALFAMIAFVTNLCTPMAAVIKAQGPISNVLAQIGNYGNFIAYLVMGIPAGMLISKFGYKKTALIGLVVGIVGIGIQWFSGQLNAAENLMLVFTVYIIGAFIAGLCMCILNCVVNPMLNILGGGGNKGNQLIQTGGVFNSLAAVACYILMGALVGDVAKSKIADVTPALLIAMGIFVIAFIVILFTKIEEPEQAPVDVTLISGAMKHRNFALGALAIFLYMGVEVGVPVTVQQMLIGNGIPAGTVGMLVAVYWFMMLVGRFLGASFGGLISSRAMVTSVSIITIILVCIGIFAPQSVTFAFPGVDWSNLSVVWQDIPVGIIALLLVGLCTSVMWGAIFNMAVEGLGKYTAIASGIFMTMVFGCAIMMFIQAQVADLFGYTQSFWVVVACAAYILFYALVGSRVKTTKTK